MTFGELLATLRQLDVRLRLSGEELRFDAPPGAMTPELRAVIREWKPQLVELLRGPALTSIPRRSSGARAPVSFAQRRMWFLHQLAPDSSLYTLVGAVRLEGVLDVEALRRGVETIVQRHEALRTTFVVHEGEPEAIVHEAGPLPMPVTDLSGLDDEARREQLDAVRIAWAREPFDLQHGPVFRVRLVREARASHVLFMAFHHIVCDGWSISVFVRELMALYEAFSTGGESPLQNLPVQYGDFAAWQRERMQGPALEQSLAYWREQLSAPLPILSMPTDRPRPDLQTFNGALQWIVVPDEVTRAATAFATRESATPFMVLLTAYYVLLARYAKQWDIVIGSPIASRTVPELEPLLGLFANTLALRARLRPDMTFRRALAHVREVCLGAFEQQDLPLELLVEQLKPARDPRYSAVYQAMFALQTAAPGALELRGLRATPLELESRTAKFDLTLSLSPRDGGLAGVLEYNTDLFDHSTIARMGECYNALLADAVVRPDARLDSLALLSPAVRAALNAAGEGAGDPFPQDATLAGLFATQVEGRPDAVAIEDGDRRWTYRHLAADAARLSSVLQAHGAGPNVPVALWMERGADLVIGVLGIAGAGAAYVPLDTTQPASRAATILTDTGARLVVTTDTLSATVPTGPWTVMSLDALPPLSDGPVRCRAVAEDLAYVMYTSGSTGRPKGVAVSQRAVVHLVCGTDYVSLGPASVVAQVATPAFDAATFEIWGALLRGGRLVIVPTAVAVSPAALGAYVRRTGINTMFLTTALVHQVGREAPGALATLDTLLFGGEAVEPRWVAAIQAAGAPRRILHVYGPTETTTFATWFPVPAVQSDASTIPIGRPIAHTHLAVLDEGGEPVPAGIAGELHIGGAGLAVGYVGSPRATAAAFRPDGVSGRAGGRMYHTGDLVRWGEDGSLEFIGRGDGQIKLRGFRIELGEIDAALSATPGVGASVVVVRGEGVNRHLVAYVSSVPGQALDGSGVRDALKHRLPSYMVPAKVIVLPALPLNANGKIDRGALPKDEPGQVDANGPSNSPADLSLEARIARVWADVLGVATVERNDNFFDLGGHSLLLVRVQAELEAALGRSVPLILLFQYPTVDALAKQLRDGDAAAMPRPSAADTGASDRAIAIVGMSARLPGAADLDTFWQQLREGREAIRRFTDEELEAAGVPDAIRRDPRYVPARATLENVDLFDAGLFGFTPREATLLDPQQRVLLETAWSALEVAGYPPATRQAPRIGVYAGTSANTYLSGVGREAVAGVGPMQLLLASDKDFLATRISYKLQLTGPSLTVQTACSTSLVAVHTACQALLARECDVALAGGVSISVPDGGYIYTPEGIASPDGRCRPFDAHAAGTVAGNGAVMVVLKRLDAARADGDTIYAVIRGSAVNNDGADKVGYTAPSVSGQAAVIRDALASAGLTADTIGYVEGHGTATALGDPIEVAALRQVFGDGAGPGTCGLGSVKGNVGHLDAAAGVTGLVKAVLSIRNGEIPPSLHFTAPNPQIELGPFFVPTGPTPWPDRPGIPRRAGVSSFGIGGTNAHVIVEQAPDEEREERPARPWQIVPVAAQSAAAVDAGASAVAASMSSGTVAAADVAFTLQTGRAPLRARRVAVGRDADEIARALAAAPTVVTAATPDLIWMFPGQGAQFVAMGRELYATEPVFRAELDACSAVVAPALDGELREVIDPRNDAEQALAIERLSGTLWAQVALVATELSLAALWRSWGIAPAAVVGHSVGEIAAACVAGVLNRDDAMRLVAARGALMERAPAGGMLAIGAAADDVATRLSDGLWLAAINGPQQCVVAGTFEALDALESNLGNAGVLVRRLSAAGAFHSALMSDAVEPLARVASALARTTPRVPWISSMTGARLTADEATDAGYWGKQLLAPVQWSVALEAARQTSPDIAWLEVGPGRTLTNLMPRTTQTVVASLPGGDGSETITRALAQLWAAGVTPDWHAYHAGFRRRRVPLPTYAFQRQRYWLERSAQAKVPTDSVLTRKADPTHWYYRPYWKQAVPITSHPREGVRRWLLLADEQGVAEALRERLLSSGHQVAVAVPGARFSAKRDRRFEMRIDDPSDYDTLLRALDMAGGTPTDVVYLLGVTGSAPSGAASSTQRCFEAVVWLGAALSRYPGQPVNLTVVTDGVHSVTGSEVLDPVKALALGPCRVIGSELAHVTCRHVDVVLDAREQRPASMPPVDFDRLCVELENPQEVVSVALRGHQRFVQAVEPCAVPAQPSTRLRDAGVYLITGGFGAIGLAIAEAMATQVRAKLVLVGRKPLPAPAEWDRYLETGQDADIARRISAVRRLEALGADVMPVAADVSSPEAMSAVFAAAQGRFGAINGIVHAAGVSGGGIVARKRAADFEEVLAPKIRGTLVLSSLLAQPSLDFLALCSSLTALLGGAGQVDYCAANSVLDAFAHARWAAGDTRVIAINWDTWRDAGMAVNAAVPAQLAPIREQALAAGLSDEEGTRAFFDALATRLPQVAICTKDLNALIGAMHQAPTAAGETATVGAAPSAATTGHPRPDLLTPYVAPTTAMERRICAAFEQALGIDGIGVQDNFFELGGHSLAAVDVMATLNRDIGATVAVAALYDGLTAARLAATFEGGDSRQAGLERARRIKDKRQADAARRRGSRARGERGHEPSFN